MSLSLMVAGLAVVLDHLGHPDAAATVYGAGSGAHQSPSFPKLTEGGRARPNGFGSG
jgi:hypothetical protein